MMRLVPFPLFLSMSLTLFLSAMIAQNTTSGSRGSYSDAHPRSIKSGTEATARVPDGADSSSGRPLFPPPRSFAAKLKMNSIAVLTWQPPDTAVHPPSYHLYRAGFNDTLFLPYSFTVQPEFSDSNLLPSGMYMYFVTACSPAGESRSSDTIMVFTSPDTVKNSGHGHDN